LISVQSKAIALNAHERSNATHSQRVTSATMRI
jgi:hypothetical protein